MSSDKHLVVRRQAPTDTAVSYRRLWDVVENFQPRSDTYVLRYGSFSLAIPALYTGYKTQNFFNKAFKLGRKNIIFIYLPSMFLPCIATAVAHRYLIVDEIFSEARSCWGCTEFVCAGIHTTSAALWTFCMSGCAGILVANLRKTMYIPAFKDSPKQVLQLLGQKYKKFGPLGLNLVLANFAFGLVVTGLEIQEYNNIKGRLLARLELSKLNERDSIASHFDAADVW